MLNPRARIAVAAAGCLLLADTLLLTAIRGGINLGTMLPGALGVSLLGYAILSRRIAQYSGWSRFQRLRRVVLFVMCMWIASFVLIESLILIHAVPQSPDSAEWLIVLGAGLRGERPSLTLQRRLERTVKFAQDHPDVRIIVSGGQGLLETISEAEAMRRYLVEHGIAPDRICTENHATSTMENLRLSKALLDANGGPGNTPVAVLSNEFHLFRVSLLAARLGLPVAGVSAPTPWYLLPNVFLREYFAVVKSLLFDW